MAAVDQRVQLAPVDSSNGRSATPAMHEAAGDALGMRVLYQLVNVPGADAAALQGLLGAVQVSGFAGFDTTFPCKAPLMPLPIVWRPA